MRWIRTLVCFALVFCLAPLAYAHPGAAIAVDARGNVYFADTLRGLWKIDPSGTLSFLGPPNFHFFALDEGDVFAKFRRHTVQDEIRPVERVATPTVLMSSDYAAVVNNGSLYFGLSADGQATRLMRAAPDGATTAVATLPAAVRWLNGIAASRDGSIYGSVDAGILRVDRAGAVTWFARDVKVPDCHAVDAADRMPSGPYLRGIAIDDASLDSSGAPRAIYAAATACGVVIRLSQTGTVSTILGANGSWTPTAVAAAGGNVYVLEYDHRAPEREWPPRVRRVDATGRVTVLATIKR